MRRPALLVGLAAALVLGAAAGAAILGGRPPAIEGAFADGPSLGSGRIATAVALADGRVLVGVQAVETTVPGTTTLGCEVPCRPHLRILDPRTAAFTLTQEAPSTLSVDSMALLHDDRVLLFGSWTVGGWTASGSGPTAVLYDAVADRFEDVGPPLEARTWPFLVTLADGRVLVAGGEGETALATAELFDPATGTFSTTGSMTRPRSGGGTATLLEDGRVLVVGGGAEVGTSAELFDPTTGMFTPTGPTTVARGGFHTATRLSDGRVLIAGGLVPDATDPQVVPDPTSTAEVFDPATGTFTAVGSMAEARYLHAASLLPDDTVLIAAGGHDLLDGVPVAAADAEIFEPSTGTFRSTGSLDRARLWPAAVTVDDRVLVLGSLDAVGDDPAAGWTTEWFE
jgi:hypothetical protein